MTFSPPKANLDFAAARPRAPDSGTLAVSARRANHAPARWRDLRVTPGPAAVAREPLDERLQGDIHRWFEASFPTSAPLHVKDRWSGVFAWTADFLPMVGAIPPPGSSGLDGAAGVPVCELGG